MYITYRSIDYNNFKWHWLVTVLFMATADLRWKVCAFGIHWWAPKEPIPVTRMYILAPQPQQPWPWLWSLDFRQLVGLKLLVECWFPTKLKTVGQVLLLWVNLVSALPPLEITFFESLDLPRSMSATRRVGFLPLLRAAVVSFLALFFRAWWNALELPLVFPGRFFFHQKTQIFILAFAKQPAEKAGWMFQWMTQLSRVGSTLLDAWSVTNSQRWGCNQSVKSCSMNQE